MLHAKETGIIKLRPFGLLARVHRYFYPQRILHQSGAHNSERATPILGLCHGVFTDQFIFRHILGHFFPRKQNLHHVYERIRSIRYRKGKLNVIKRQKNNIFRSVSFAAWIVEFKRYSKFAPKPF